MIELGVRIISETVRHRTVPCLSDEYYYITGRFFGIDTVAGELASLIAEYGSATLRTDFGLDDETFIDIVQEVLRLLDMDNIFGFHWLGVIHLTIGT